MYDGVPMMSAGVDAGIMVTTAIPGYDVHAANLGNSDNVRVGDGVISVGNPMLMSKFTTQGIVSQTNYNLFQSPAADFIFNYIRSGSQYDAWVNDNFWIDTTIGIGGVSGSGVWALQGPEQGKVVALRNAGLQSRNKMMLISESREVEPDSMPYDFVLGEITEKTAEKYFEDLFGDYPHTDARYTELVESSEFGEIYKQSGYSRVSGMNIGIPINRIKQFLQERGIDPSKLGWEPVSENYWE